MIRKISTLVVHNFLKLLLVLTLSLAGTNLAASKKIENNWQVKTIASGLNHPWSLVFLTHSTVLISERNGGLVLLELTKGKRTKLDIPATDVYARGQGGLLDLALHPDYVNNGWIYLSYSGLNESGSSTKIVRFKLKQNTLTHWQQIYTASPRLNSAHHFAGRLVFDDDGYLYISVGDRGHRQLAQNTSNDIGKILRLNDNGSIPKDNPFNNAIYSYGHRNPQGLIFNQGMLIAHEHGPRGGDELNIIKKGVNYGWPIISYGKEYSSNQAVGIGTHKSGMAQPVHYWVPSIAPSGLAVYQAHNNSNNQGWQGQLLIGSLKFKELVNLTLNSRFKVIDEQRLWQNKFNRIRDIKVQNGRIYILSDTKNGQLFELSPKG